jgi:hypothetical protein
MPERGLSINDRGDVIYEAEAGLVFHDGVTGAVTTLSADVGPSPSLNNGGDVAWVKLAGSDYEIFHYDYSSGAVTQLTDDSRWDFAPLVSDAGDVVWRTSDGSGNYSVRFYDASTGQTTILSEKYGTGLGINTRADVVWGQVDHIDSEIFLLPGGPDCSDNRDNDGDGLMDYPEDLGCSNAADDSERNLSFPCDDGIDNDLDGLTDYIDLDGDGGISDPPGDPACKLPTWGRGEDSECQDGINNDGKFGTDWDGGVSAGQPADPDGHDPQCLNQPWKNREETGGRRCGIGSELVLLVLPVLWLRRRRNG